MLRRSVLFKARDTRPQRLRPSRSTEATQAPVTPGADLVSRGVRRCRHRLLGAPSENLQSTRVSAFTRDTTRSKLAPLKLEIFTLCDSAVDYGGKVCILGAFDSVAAAEAPYTVSHCAVVARMRFHRIEEGNHKLRITLADQDGKMIMPNVDAQVGVRFTEKAQSATFNLVMQINGLKLEQFGEYTVDLAVDGVHQGSIPLYFGKTPQPANTDSASES